MRLKQDVFGAHVPLAKKPLEHSSPASFEPLPIAETPPQHSATVMPGTIKRCSTGASVFSDAVWRLEREAHATVRDSDGSVVLQATSTESELSAAETRRVSSSFSRESFSLMSESINSP